MDEQHVRRVNAFFYVVERIGSALAGPLADFITVSTVVPAPQSSLSPLPSPLPTSKTFGFYAVTRINPLFVEETCSVRSDSGDKFGETDRAAANVDRVESLDNGDLQQQQQQQQQQRRRRRNLFAFAKQNCDFIRGVFVSAVQVNRRGRRRRRTSAEDVANGVERSRSQHLAGNSLPGLAVASGQRRRRNDGEEAPVSSGNESWLAGVGSGLSKSNLNRRRRRIRCRLERYRSQHSTNIRYEYEPSDEYASAAIPYEKQTCSNCSSAKPYAAATTDCHGRAFTPSGLPLPSRIARPSLRFRDETDECLRNTSSPTWPPPPAPVPTIFCRTYESVRRRRRRRRGAAFRRKSKNNDHTIAGGASNTKLHDPALPYSGEFAPYADGQTQVQPLSSPQLSRTTRSSLLSFSSAASASGFSYVLASVSVSNSSTLASHKIEMGSAPPPLPPPVLTKRDNAPGAGARGVIAIDTVRFDVLRTVLKTKGGEISIGTLRGGLVLPNAAPNSVCNCIAPAVSLQFPYCQRIDIACAAASSQGQLQTPSYSYNYNYNHAGRRFPDFTLDVQQAEKIVRKMKNRKRKRRWCQLVMCCIGLVFLLFSVMLFSMVLTGGEKLFGPLAFYD